VSPELSRCWPIIRYASIARVDLRA
jgi:hypothetical protein